MAGKAGTGCQELFSCNMPPLHIALLRQQESVRTWAAELQLLYICEGSVQLDTGTVHTTLSARQVAVINPYQIHRLQSDGGVVAVVSLDLEALKQSCPQMETPPLLEFFDPKNRLALPRLKRQLAQILKYATLTGEQHWLAWLANACELYDLIVATFGTRPEEDTEQKSKTERIANELRFAAEHFREPLSPKAAAARCFLSISYFSKLFHDTVGVSYTDYLEELRLAAAHRALLESKASIQQIALDCGFSSARAFSGVFQKKYGALPRAYRQSVLRQQGAEPPTLQMHRQYTAELSEYLETLDDQASFLSKTLHSDALVVDTAKEGEPFRHSWKKSIGIGRARSLLYAEIQDILRDVQKHIGFEQAMLHSLLDDDMMVASRNEDGTLALSFSYIDIAVDFLLSVGMKPVMQLGYMPRALARDFDNIKYRGNSVLSLPQSLNEWRQLVRELVQHLQRRYGFLTVREWEFCLWSKPDSSEHMFGYATLEEFFEFYRATWLTIKQCDEGIVFRSPAFLSDTAEGTPWLEDFFALCKRGGCLPDRFSMDFYPINEHNDPDFTIDKASMTLQYREEPDAMRRSLARVHETLRRLELPYESLCLEEWNNTVSYREPLNDTAFKAPFIVKNALENWRMSEDMCYWSCSDMMEEDSLPNELFHGGLGLYGFGGIRKSGFYAMQLLARLGSNVILEAEGCFVTRSHNTYQVLLYNYCHFSKLYATGELFGATSENSYAPFTRMDKRLFNLTLDNMVNGSWVRTERILNRRHGSAYDQWLRMGAQQVLDAAESEYLRGIAQPLLQRSIINVTNRTVSVTAELEPFAVHLIEFHPD